MKTKSTKRRRKISKTTTQAKLNGSTSIKVPRDVYESCRGMAAEVGWDIKQVIIDAVKKYKASGGPKKSIAA